MGSGINYQHWFSLVLNSKVETRFFFFYNIHSCITSFDKAMPYRPPVAKCNLALHLGLMSETRPGPSGWRPPRILGCQVAGCQRCKRITTNREFLGIKAKTKKILYKFNSFIFLT